MRIGIDCRVLEEKEPAGTSLYTLELVRSLLFIDQKNQYVLFFQKPPYYAVSFNQPNAAIVTVGKLTGARIPFVSSHIAFSFSLAKHGLDVFHAPANTLPIGFGGKTVLTIHDLAIYRNPEWFPRQSFATRVLVPRSLAKATHIIAVSESTKNDLQQIFRVPQERVSVIYEGVREEPVNDAAKQSIFQKFRIDSERGFFLFLGTIEPRKNLVTLLSAYRALVKKFPDAPRMIFAGGRGWNNEDVFSAIQKWGLNDAVRYVGYVSHEEKLVLMKNAQCLVYPSLYEGFGLPILESMSLGVPVLTSRTSSIPEVAGDAALLVDPNDDEEIAKGLEKFWKDESLRADIISKGKSRVKLFDWKKTAEQTLAVYEHVARKRS
ncbi:MAG TPA: glycosyltransferase family 1 protein [Patescibacteria group bacterium]|nr:glycosyltransferase family 1 protein [Patescibacteria group bacterium]